MRLAKDDAAPTADEEFLQVCREAVGIILSGICKTLNITDNEFNARLHVHNLFGYIQDVLIERESDND